LYAGLRFLLAGLLLTAWLAFRGVELRVSRRELGGAAVVGILMLCVANGLVVLAERTVPSGVAALIVASIPLCIVIYRMVAGERVRLSRGVRLSCRVQRVHLAPAERIGFPRLHIRVRESGRRRGPRRAHPRRADHSDDPARRRGYRRRGGVHRVQAERGATYRASRARRGGRGLASARRVSIRT